MVHELCRARTRGFRLLRGAAGVPCRCWRATGEARFGCRVSAGGHSFTWAVFLFLAGLVMVQAQSLPLRRVAEVRRLSVMEAAERRSVHLQAVVIDRADPWERAVVVADDTAGLYVLAETNLFAPYQRGDLLEIAGVTDPGEFAPMVKAATAVKLGRAELPPPRTVTYHQLLTGSMDAQWVEVAGIVQQYTPAPAGEEIHRLVLLVDGQPVHAHFKGKPAPDLAEDSEVRLRAVCLYQFTRQRRLISPILSVPAGEAIVVQKPAPADPFAIPMRPAASLLLFSAEPAPGHRVRVRGVVTHNQDGVRVWLRDATAGLRVQCRAPTSVQPGDEVEVVGFPKYGVGAPLLEGAQFRLRATTAPPLPVMLRHPTNAWDHEDDLVALESMLTDVAAVMDGYVLTLESAGVEFKALWKTTPDAPRPPWRTGSRVQLAGICLINYDETTPVTGIWRPQSFQLLLRSPAEVVILQAPSWWTLQHVTYLLGAALAVLVTATGIISWRARRRLREQAHQRALAEAEFAAILAERNRMAREIHDTLAQGLTAIALRLRLAKRHAVHAGEAVRQELDAAQELVQANLAEARNSIWNMRAQVLETGDLPTALHHILSQMSQGSGCRTEFQVTGRIRRLAPVTENNLLRIGQEAITNAIRHAQATQLNLCLDFGEDRFRLKVQDNGCGFDPQQSPPGAGRFGLAGMRERVEEMLGHLEIRSAPGKGTLVVVDIPLPREEGGMARRAAGAADITPRC